MIYLIGAAVYLLIHFVTYAIWLRRRPAFSHERVILLFHVCSAAVLSIAVAVIFLVDQMNMTLPFAVAIVCLHGLYSLSFLELWALADAGFSLSILRKVEETTDSPMTLATLRHLGDRKRGARTHDMVAIGLVRQAGDVFELTPFGRRVADVMHTLGRVSNLQDVG